MTSGHLESGRALCASQNTTCPAHTSGNEVSGAFNGLPISQPNSLSFYKNSAVTVGRVLPSECTCLVDFHLQLLGLRSQAGIWSQSLGSLKPPTRQPVRELEETILTSALLPLIPSHPLIPLSQPSPFHAFCFS